MPTSSDSHFAIGAGHVICQDYALHGALPYGEYIMGADGCSSSEKSELGARLLCESARKLLEIHDGRLNVNYLRQSLLQELRQHKTNLRLETSNFDATFWLSLVTNSTYLILGWGDGVVRKEFNDGGVSFDHIEFASNAPRYLSYGLDPKRYEGYLAASKDLPVILTSYRDGEETNESQLPVDDFFFFEEGDIAGLKNISIMSDGINTFKEAAATQMLPFDKMANSVCDFVNLKGVFVERQMNWLAKEHKKKGIIHVDDLFCASIAIS